MVSLSMLTWRSTHECFGAVYGLHLNERFVNPTVFTIHYLFGSACAILYQVTLVELLQMFSIGYITD